MARTDKTPEERLRAARKTGELVDLRTGDAEADDPAGGGEWGPERTIPGEVLADLLTTPPEAGTEGASMRPRPLRLAGARITGQLDLEAAEILSPVTLAGCWFEETVVLKEASAQAIKLPGCHLPGLKADQLVTRGSVELEDGFTANGEVRLPGAQISGQLSLEGATLNNPDGHALFAEVLAVGQDMYCHLEFTATGEMRLLGAHIKGELSLVGATLNNPDGIALNADGLIIDQSMRCDDLTTTGEISLIGAHIGGQLSLSGATLNNPKGRALDTERVTVDQSMSCGFEFSAKGEIDLSSAHIKGTFDLTGATLDNPDGAALNASDLTVNQDMHCGAVNAKGEINLIAAHIGSTLSFDGATLDNPNGTSLNANSLKVGRSVLCRDGLTARGEFDLHRAQIGSTLELSGATLSNPHGISLNASSIKIEQDAFIGDKFHASGTVHLQGASIGGQLDLTGSSLNTNPNGAALNASDLTVNHDMFCGTVNANGEINLIDAHIGSTLSFDGATLNNPNGTALNASGLTVKQRMLCQDGFTAAGEINLMSAVIEGQLLLAGATLNNPAGIALRLQEAKIDWLWLRPAAAPEGLVDLNHAHAGKLTDDPSTWPEKIQLYGFTYDTLAEIETVSAGRRLDWLDSEAGAFSPQPHEQLAAVYRRAGREEDARLVAIAKQRRRRSSGDLGLVARAWSHLLGALIGHGYRPWLAGLWLAGILLIGTMIFAGAHPQDLVQAKLDEVPPDFQPFVYALDVLLPVVNLGQESAWHVQGWAQVWAWFSILAGWVLTSAVVAALTGLIKRD